MEVCGHGDLGLCSVWCSVVNLVAVDIIDDEVGGRHLVVKFEDVDMGAAMGEHDVVNYFGAEGGFADES